MSELEISICKMHIEQHITAIKGYLKSLILKGVDVSDIVKWINKSIDLT